VLNRWDKFRDNSLYTLKEGGGGGEGMKMCIHALHVTRVVLYDICV